MLETYGLGIHSSSSSASHHVDHVTSCKLYRALLVGDFASSSSFFSFETFGFSASAALTLFGSPRAPVPLGPFLGEHKLFKFCKEVVCEQLQDLTSPKKLGTAVPHLLNQEIGNHPKGVESP